MRIESSFRSLVAYELRILLRRKRDLVLVLTFYLLAGMMMALFTVRLPGAMNFAVDTLAIQLRPVAMIWLLLMFSQVVGFDSLFEDEFRSGWMAHSVQQNYPLAPWLMIRILCRSAVLGGGLLVVTPLQGLWFPIAGFHIATLMMGIAAALPGLTSILVMVSALQPRRNARMLLPLLILPLWMPFIFLGFVAVFSDNRFYAIGVLLMMGIATTCAAPILAARALVSHVTLR